MSAIPPQSDGFYTPARVRLLLRLYPYLASGRPPTDRELVSQSRRALSPSAWWEEAAARRMDVKRAVEWLASRDERAAYAINAHCVAGYPQTAIARDLGVHKSTVSRFCADGVELMAAYLSGQLGGNATLV